MSLRDPDPHVYFSQVRVMDSTRFLGEIIMYIGCNDVSHIFVSIRTKTYLLVQLSVLIFRSSMFMVHPPGFC